VLIWNDRNTRRQLEAELKPTVLPGGYLNYLCQVDKFLGDTQDPRKDNPYAGKWLSLEQLAEVLTKMRLYIMTNDVRSEALAKKLDNSWPGGSYERGERRFCSNDSQTNAIQEWIDILSDMYIVPMEQMKKKDPNDRRLTDPMYVRHFTCNCVLSSLRARGPNAPGSDITDVETLTNRIPDSSKDILKCWQTWKA
jgi:hypothetical protein